METWVPNNISAVCAHEQAPLTQCSSTGFMFLSLVTQLFGATSYSISYTGADLYPSETQTVSWPIPTSVTSYPPSTSPPQTTASNNNGPYGQPNQSSGSQIPNSNNFGTGSFLPSSIPLPYSGPSATNSGPFTGQQMNDPNIVIVDDTSRWKRQATSEYYDFIIVGAGSAGCVLANRLSEIKEWKILLLEAGPEEPDITMVPSFAPLLRLSSIDWNYKTQPEELTCRGFPGQTCAWPRGKTMGGCSAINYMVYMRGNRLDYDGWAQLGNPGWSFDELLPYFKKSENNRNVEADDTEYHGVGGPINVERYPYTDRNALMIVEAFKERGLPVKDLTLPDNLGVNIGQSTSKDGRRFSVNVAYIRPIRYVRPNLDIITNAYVTKIIIDPNTKVAQGVTVLKDDTYINFYATKEVIVSAGALNSPKLLMLSGVGPKEELEKLNIPVIADLKVGYNLQDHVTSEGLSIGFSNKTSTTMTASELLSLVSDYRMQDPYNNGPLSSTGTLNAIAFIKTKYAPVNAPDIQYHFDARDIQDFDADPLTYIPSNILPLAFASGVGVRTLLLTPKSRGRVKLNETDPVFGQPLIYPGFFTVKEDLDALIEGMNFAVSLGETDAFKRNGAFIDRTPMVGCQEHVWGSYDYFACLFIKYTAVIFHPSGTCKMGPSSDNDAVVNPRLQVYGLKNLRVVDASIMPLVVRGNTNVPIVTIAEKTSDMIKEDFNA